MRNVIRILVNRHAMGHDSVQIVKVLYFDCFAGAAGDMILGALLDAGLPFDELKRALGSLAVEGWDVSVDKVVKAGVTATKFRVLEHAHADHHHHDGQDHA